MKYNPAADITHPARIECRYRVRRFNIGDGRVISGHIPSHRASAGTTARPCAPEPTSKTKQAKYNIAALPIIGCGEVLMISKVTITRAVDTKNSICHAHMKFNP